MRNEVPCSRHCSTSQPRHRLTATVTSLMLCPMPLVLGRAIIVVYIEFAWNHAGFNSNDYYFLRLTQLWKSTNYANKSLNYSSVGDSWIPVWVESMYKYLQTHWSSNCVLLRVPINNNNYEQLIALFIIIAKNTSMNHHGVIYCCLLAPSRPADATVATSINKCWRQIHKPMQQTRPLLLINFGAKSTCQRNSRDLY